ncbi:helix-turn-helix transcriptional regulator [Phytomonospora sp. NPDC050363]|uniref:helix-turn-helix domain-containing protein n=1 Tax=Phytomonospora sp. NPDC050363 TaxID=3155642 RepID=UPI0033FC36CB
MRGQAPKALTPVASPLHFFGAEVRRFRTARGWSTYELGRRLHQSGDLVRKIEVAEKAPAHGDFVKECDDVLEARGALLRMWPLINRERKTRARNPSTTDQFHPAADDRAVLDWLLTDPEPARIPQDSIAAGNAAAQLVILRQIDHLQGAGRTYSHVTGYLSRDLSALTGVAPEVAIGYLELAGYEAVDLGSDGRAQRHYLDALRIATVTGDRLYGGYIVGVSLAHLALHCGDPRHAARLSMAALRGIEAESSPALRAACRTVLARAHARLGDERACTAALREVEGDLSRSNPTLEPPWIRYFGHADLADEMAHAWFDLGRHGQAHREAVTSISLLEPSRVRRLAMENALAAAALARSAQIEEGCHVAREAIVHASKTASFRSLHRVTMMLAEFHPYGDTSAVKDLREFADVTLDQPAVEM